MQIDTRWNDIYGTTGADVLQVIDWAQRQAGHQMPRLIRVTGRQGWAKSTMARRYVMTTTRQ